MAKLIRQLGQPSAFHRVAGQKGTVGGCIQSIGMVRLRLDCLLQSGQGTCGVTGS